MSACFRSDQHEQRLMPKNDDPDYLKNLELVGQYETLGKLASRTYVAQRWLGEERETADQICYDVARTKAYSWLSEMHQPISVNRQLRFRNRVLPFHSATPCIADLRRPDGNWGYSP